MRKNMSGSTITTLHNLLYRVFQNWRIPNSETPCRMNATTMMHLTPNILNRIWYSLSSERLVPIKITKFYQRESIVPNARKI
jgi:hypothetical protein